MSYELCILTCGQIKELHSPLVGSVCPTVQVPSALRTCCRKIINAHDGDHDEDDVDDSDEVLPVHTNQRQLCGFACDCIPLYNNNCLSSTVYIISLGLKGLEFQESH